MRVACPSLPRRSALAGVLVASLLASPAIAAPYKLGPEDHVMLKVWDLRNGDPYQWVALNGEFSVGADGNLSLPIVGEIKASGVTTTEIAGEIGAALQAKVGLSGRPDASVQITKYRPFYVMGAVQRPGRYEYQPGLTVLQAVSTAEGIVRVSNTDLAGVQRQIIGGRGDVRVLDAERMALLARQARLAAEISGTSDIAYPPDLRRRAAEPSVDQAMKQENQLFLGRREALAAQLAALEKTKSVLRSEQTSLAAKDASLSHQLDLTRKDLSQVSDLVSKGIAVMPRQLAAEQTVAGFEGSKLDVQITGLKVQQDLSQAERDGIELRTAFKTGALSEASDVRAKLDANNERMVAARGLVRQAEATAPGLADPSQEVTPLYVIARAADGKSVPAGERDAVEPGDVLRVSLPLSDNAAAVPQDAAQATGGPQTAQRGAP